MLKPKSFANAIAVISLGFYVVCRVASLVAPDALFAIGRSWFHTISMESVRTVAPMDLGTFILGGVSLGVLAWISGYTVAVAYNNFAKSEK